MSRTSKNAAFLASSGAYFAGQPAAFASEFQLSFAALAAAAFASNGNRTGIGLNGRSRPFAASYASKIVAIATADGGFQRSGRRSAMLSSEILSMRSRTSATYSTGFTPTRVQETTSE